MNLPGRQQLGEMPAGRGIDLAVLKFDEPEQAQRRRARYRDRARGLTSCSMRRRRRAAPRTSSSA